MTLRAVTLIMYNRLLIYDIQLPNKNNNNNNVYHRCIHLAYVIVRSFEH